MKRWIIVGLLVMAVSLTAAVASANHSSGSYHWARTSNPFTLKLGDNLSSTWDPYLATTSFYWSKSNALDTNIVAGLSPNCNFAIKGRVEVCNRKYGTTGWLGLSQIWTSGDHITAGLVKMNDTYFNTPNYNTPEWRNTVMCQEVAHTFGLDHQDENFSNPNLGTCMDYTSNPTSNQHPNAHDYEQLEIIYAHLDSTTTIAASPASAAFRRNADTSEESDFGTPAGKKDQHRRDILFVKHLDAGQELYTWVVWDPDAR